MEKKKWKFAYIVLFVFFCMVPFLFLGIAGMQESTENKSKKQFPHIYSEKKWNVDYLADMGEWFQENFAFRQEMVSANAKMLSDVFQVSATKKITVGSDGWLYYSATLDDYKGKSQLSDRGIFNLSRTVALMQRRAEENGAKFVFTVPPNKNTLYGEHMPYYEKKTGKTTNLERLSDALKKQKVHYVDLYQTFKDQKETLYLKRDSHWNQKGAVLAYHTILKSVKWPHNEYKNIVPEKRKDYIGDLAKMLYPKVAEPEVNQYYPEIFSYDYLGKSESVEDSEISTIGYSGTGSLLMYRDSFGNTLLPLMSGEFGKAYYSKLVPYYLDDELKKCKPDVVVVEKVERHLNSLAAQPPVMRAPEVKVKEKVQSQLTETTFQAAKMDNSLYMAMGTIDETYMKEDTLIFVKVTGSDKKSKIYEAFPVTIQSKKNSTDYGYLLYLDDASVPKGKVKTEVLVKNNDSVMRVKTDISKWRK